MSLIIVEHFCGRLRVFASPVPQCCSKQVCSLPQHSPCHSLKENGYRHCKEERIVGQDQPETAQPL